MDNKRSLSGSCMSEQDLQAYYDSLDVGIKVKQSSARRISEGRAQTANAISNILALTNPYAAAWVIDAFNYIDELERRLGDSKTPSVDVDWKFRYEKTLELLNKTKIRETALLITCENKNIEIAELRCFKDQGSVVDRQAEEIYNQLSELSNQASIINDLKAHPYREAWRAFRGSLAKLWL